MLCAQCSSNISSSFSVCPYCGFSTGTVACWTCGSSKEDSALLCSDCGAENLDGSASIHSLRNRGDFFINAGEFKEAIDVFSSILNILPSDPTSYYKRGYCLGREGARGKALLDFEKAVLIRPGYLEAYLGIADLAYKTQDFKKLKNISEEILDIEPENVDALYYAGVVSEQSGDTQEAIRLYSSVINEDCRNVRALLRRAGLYYPHDFPLALSDYCSALDANLKSAMNNSRKKFFLSILASYPSFTPMTSNDVEIRDCLKALSLFKRGDKPAKNYSVELTYGGPTSRRADDDIFQVDWERERSYHTDDDDVLDPPEF